MPCFENQLPSCPVLPEAPATMDWRALSELGPDRGPVFYLRCLQYGNQLWQHRLAARAILCLDRALFADLKEEASILSDHPLPYRALAWMLRHAPADVFIGNPRAHYQHLADRVRGPRQEIRAARAWACWHIVRATRPEFPGDPRHHVRTPSLEETTAALIRHGMPDEADTWKVSLAGSGDDRHPIIPSRCSRHPAHLEQVKS